MKQHAPDWADLPPKVERMFRFDIAMVVVFGVIAVVSWGYDPFARAMGWPLPEEWWFFIQGLAMLWTPWEFLRFGRKVQIWSRIRGKFPLEAARTNAPSWEEIQMTGGPSRPPLWRPFRMFLWPWGVYQWNYRIQRPLGQPTVYANPRAMAIRDPTIRMSFSRYLWIATDAENRHLVVIEPEGRYVQVCRRARWVEAHPTKVLWWMTDDIPPRRTFLSRLTGSNKN